MSSGMGGTTGLWESAEAEATLPAQDVERAKASYAQRLGMSPTYEDKVGVHFVDGATRFRLFKSGGTASGSHTQLALIVVTSPPSSTRSAHAVFTSWSTTTPT